MNALNELFADLRLNGHLILLRTLLLTLSIVSLYYICSFHGVTDNQTSVLQEDNYELYQITDALYEEDSYSAFAHSQKALESAAKFYNALNNQETTKFLSIYNIRLPVERFVGDERFDHTYGIQSKLDSEPYELEPGILVKDVKSVQLNRNAFEFFNLEVALGHGIEWDNISYLSGKIPVLLGSAYAGTYSVGDEIDCWLYGSSHLQLKVNGFLEPNSTVFLADDYGPNHSIDTSIVVPYPTILDIESTCEPDLLPNLIWMMLSGFVAVPENAQQDAAISTLDRCAAISGFHNYEMIQTSSYALQNLQLRTLMKSRFQILEAISIVALAGALLTAFALNVPIIRNRKARDRVWTIVGLEPKKMQKVDLTIRAMELFLVICVLFIVFLLQTYREEQAALACLGAFALFVVGDVLLQQALIKRQGDASERGER